MNYVIELVVIIAIAYLALDADDSYRTGAGSHSHNLKSWLGLGLAGILTIFLICNAFA